MHRLVWDAVDVLVDAVGVELPLILTTTCTCGTLMPGSFHLLDKSDFRFDDDFPTRSKVRPVSSDL